MAGNGYRPLSLRCKAAVYTGDAITSFDLSGNGEILIPNVDHFRVLLGVARDNEIKNPDGIITQAKDGVMDDFLYVSPSEYIKLADKPQIVSIQYTIQIIPYNKTILSIKCGHIIFTYNYNSSKIYISCLTIRCMKS